MTDNREKLAREVLRNHGFDDQHDRAVKVMLAFADREAEGMRERYASYLDGYAGGHYMAKSCASAIRSMTLSEVEMGKRRPPRASEAMKSRGAR